MNFSRADLSLGNFRLANLKRADFSGCRGFDADLSGSLLIGANFEGATLQEADLRFARRDRRQLHRRGPQGRGPGQLRLHRGHLQEDEVLGRHRAARQAPEGQGAPLLPVDDVLEGQGEEDQGGRREGSQAPEADRRSRGRGLEEGAAPDRPALAAPNHSPLSLGASSARSASGFLRRSRRRRRQRLAERGLELAGAAGSTRNPPGRPETRAAISPPRGCSDSVQSAPGLSPSRSPSRPQAPGPSPRPRRRTPCS